MQALARRRPIHVGHRGIVHHEFEYRRRGTCSLLASFDIRTGEVFGRVVRHRDARALMAFMHALAQRYYGRRVYVIWDNLNLHHDGRDARWTRLDEEHGHRFRFVHTPLHASWVDELEVSGSASFSAVSSATLRYGSFESVAALAHDVLAFIRHWNRAEARPFRWTFAGRFVDSWFASPHKLAEVSRELAEATATAGYAPLQGQYLAFIYAYSTLNRRPPAEADMQAFFGVTAPPSTRWFCSSNGSASSEEPPELHDPSSYSCPPLLSHSSSHADPRAPSKPGTNFRPAVLVHRRRDGIKAERRRLRHHVVNRRGEG